MTMTFLMTPSTSAAPLARPSGTLSPSGKGGLEAARHPRAVRQTGFGADSIRLTPGRPCHDFHNAWFGAGSQPRISESDGQ